MLKSWQAASTSELPEPLLSFLGGELALVVGEIDNLVIGVIGKVDNLNRVSLLSLIKLCLYFLTFLKVIPVKMKTVSIEMTPNDMRNVLVLLERSMTETCEVVSPEIVWAWFTSLDS